VKPKTKLMLLVCDPREGWAYATAIDCKSIDQVHAHVTVFRSEHKRFKFALSVENPKLKTFIWRRGRFVGITDNVPLEAWVGGSK
jgi:hypothetical protein